MVVSVEDRQQAISEPVEDKLKRKLLLTAFKLRTICRLVPKCMTLSDL